MEVAGSWIVLPGWYAAALAVPLVVGIGGCTVPNPSYAAGDQGALPVQFDKGSSPLRDLRPDSGQQPHTDQHSLVDQAPTHPPGTCPCPSGSECLKDNQCYVSCTPDDCAADSACAADKVCLGMYDKNSSVVYVCYPASAGPHQQCNYQKGVYCQNHLICMVRTQGDQTGICQPLCDASDQSCSGGGWCWQVPSGFYRGCDVCYHQ